MTTLSKHILSKSTFVKGCQCTKALYLYKYQPKLATETSEQQQAIFDQGTTVGELARQLFPNGVDASPATPFEYQKSVLLTQKLIEEGHKVIYEAAFQFDGVLAAIDILVNEKGKWKGYEVKSSTEIKDVVVIDASLQYYVITNSGIALKDISIVYINNQYLKKGDLEINSLFNIESVKDRVVSNQDFVKAKIAELKKVVNANTVPSVDIGEHCSTPYPCDFMEHCWKHVPENSVFDISNLRSKRKFELYGQGIVRFEDLTEEIKLNDNQWLQVRSYLKQTEYLDKKGIKDFLKTLSYPIFFLDFESFQTAIPLYDQSSPYQQIVFQYSLHYLKSNKSELEHHEFLAEPEGDPRIQLIEQLLSDTRQPGDILTYNQTFEIARLNEIARDFPAYSKAIEERVSRIKDLMAPFQQKLYYKPPMNGSYSIKQVLPALLPELSYENLEIGEGGDASIAFKQMIFDKSADRKAIRKNLLEYCKMDTLAMVKILEHLESL